MTRAEYLSPASDPCYVDAEPTAGMTNDVAEVPYQLDLLSQATDHLGKTMFQLLERLAPVVRPEDESPDVTPSELAPRTGLGQRLALIRSDVETLSARVRSHLDRLGL